MSLNENDRVRAVTAALVSSFNLIAKKMGLSPDDAAIALGWAALEGVAERMGPGKAIDHLRNIADVAEQQLIAEAASPWDSPDFKLN